jgi:hypothetical protein
MLNLKCTSQEHQLITHQIVVYTIELSSKYFYEVILIFNIFEPAKIDRNQIGI